MLRINDFVKREDLTDFQIHSFNWLLDTGLREVIDEKGPLEIDIPDYNLELGKIGIGQPCVNESGQGPEPRTPAECRLQIGRSHV